MSARIRSHKKVVVLAEDETDLLVMAQIIRRIRSDLGIQGHAGKGCAQLSRKAARWIRDDFDKGFRWFVILHDLDRNPKNGALNDRETLRKRLAIAFKECGVHDGLVCIPVEELEAWFFSTQACLNKVARGQITKSYPQPEAIPKPKEALMGLSIDPQTRKSRYSTNDNPELAKILDLEQCKKRCPSFLELHQFIVSLPK